MKWQASSSSEVCFAARRHHIPQGWGLGLPCLQHKTRTWFWVTREVHAVGHRRLCYHPFWANRSPPPSPAQWTQSKAHTRPMLCTERQAAHNVGSEKAPHGRHVTGRWLPDSQGRQTAAGTCLEGERVQNAPAYHSLLTRPNRLLPWFESGPSERTWFCGRKC